MSIVDCFGLQSSIVCTCLVAWKYAGEVVL